MSRGSTQRGSLLLVVVVIIVIVATLAGFVTHMFVVGTSSATLRMRSKQAYYIAESGLRYALSELATGGLSCTQLNGVTKNFGEGQFQLATSYYDPAADLQESLNSSDTSIKVGLSDVGQYAPSGRVVIDSEIISYTGKAGAYLVGATRGVDGSVAASHITVDPVTGVTTKVAQDLCVINSQGAVPTVGSNAQASHTFQINHFVGFFDVGRAVGTDGSIYYLKNGIWYPESSGTTATFWWAGCTSLNNCLAVGDSGHVVRYDGSGWSNDSGFTWGTYLYGGTCVNQNDCWAVGSSGYIYHYNGTTWGLSTDTGSSSLTEISCNGADDCWAVGVSGSSGYAYHYYKDPSDGLMKWSGNMISGATGLYGLTCLSSDNCYASGMAGRVYHYNGATWSEILNTGDSSQILYEVVCANANKCWAMGAPSGGVGKMYEYDGSSWTTINLSNPTAPAANVAPTIRFARCFSPNNCWAVGHRGVIYYYNGSTWTYTQTVGDGSIDLQAVAAASLEFAPLIYGYKEIIN